jgi:hypothetical protein
MTETNQSTATTRISTYIMTIILIVIALAIVALVSAVQAYIVGNQTLAGYLLIIGFIAMTVAAYFLYQSRRHVMNMKIEIPKVMTTIECRKCGFKTVREFQRGDFVYKEMEKCQKCDDKMTITAIYKEVTEKEKTFPV